MSEITFLKEVKKDLNEDKDEEGSEEDRTHQSIPINSNSSLKKREYKKRMGRPWKGEVGNTQGKEGDVFIKKSIFRANKKFWGKRIFINYKRGKFNE
jgi:hypothetical protein